MSPSLSPSSERPVLVVFSHLRWGFVHQRPQHLLSRLARHGRVVFVEEPVFDLAPARLVVQTPCAGVTVLVPHTPVRATGFHDDQLPLIEPLLHRHLRQEGIHSPVVWLYTPMALPLVAPLQPCCVVYDCVDEPAAAGSGPTPGEPGERERALLACADVVFTAGPSLYEARQGLHDNLHCIPSSVDAAHFAPRRQRNDSPQAREAAALQAGLPGPRLGFFGVIDDRLDLGLIGAIADRHPDWQIVMVGPVVKINTRRLPMNRNIHWLGMRRYDLLPCLLAGWDLCLVPYANKASTRFISPAKTLEYMAGEKPVVSTAIRDVATLYGHAVEIADGHEAFIEACERVLSEPPDAACRRAMEMLTTVSRHSWNHSADSVRALIDNAVQRARPAGACATVSPAPAGPPRALTGTTPRSGGAATVRTGGRARPRATTRPA